MAPPQTQAMRDALHLYQLVEGEHFKYRLTDIEALTGIRPMHLCRAARRLKLRRYLTGLQKREATHHMRKIHWYVVTREGQKHNGCYRARNGRTLCKRLRREFPRAERVGYWL